MVGERLLNPIENGGMSPDYLRSFGLVARITKGLHSEQEIFSPKTPRVFIAKMVKPEAKR